MNNYSPKSPEYGNNTTPPSIDRRLRITDLSARFIASANRHIVYSPPSTPNQAVLNNVITFPVNKVASVETMPVTEPVRVDSTARPTPEFKIPESPSRTMSVAEPKEVKEGNVVDMDQYRMEQDAQQKLDDIFKDIYGIA